ncbi:nicotinate-nucleotide--dimethylbenzimidazole phosphoribosyltransferase [Lacibacter sediminis]|uniref:Nicotinate-nucleotide--dimethylbenzimidazole phosphoribosyltransferase n=1 Tax=Lacibacter sediminis TaxID=2760713 RepID=A0A7G5XES2_9BACT|nr:nicotinate-nucleotide--dimethylbenzimidazole phosphoribosyltransferase [Lacibacter sediminis]QNA43975.1 nicotinate-nucleotide--dimethylbenzimidazole phosphoribosyltransferase [Lacibacter sediminis]
MTLEEQLQHKINNKTKPLGALGMLEELALKIGTVQNSLSPTINKPHIVVFAGDHGIAATGKVNPYPQAVTAQMVLNFVNGGAAINVFTKQHNIGLIVVDAGVNFDFDASLPIVHAKINHGTADYSKVNAMNIDEVNAAIEKGRSIVQGLFDEGCNTIGFGEMGIGNTSSASLIMHHLLNLPLSECVGRGTGTTAEQLQRKLDTLEDVSRLHELNHYDITPHQLLCRIGGFELAMMVGAYHKAAELNMIIVVDGFIATAALLVAKQYNQTITGHCVFAHCSDENGHRKMLEHLNAKPILQLGMRLGEGTGAALAIPLLQSAVQFLNEMASFESAGVSGKE